MVHIAELLRKALELPSDSMELDLALFAEIRETATVGDLPLLLAALKSDKSNFWVREMLADPVSALGGPSVLPDLLVAFQKNLEDGHDNDSFALFLTDLVEEDQARSAEVLRSLMTSGDEQLNSTVAWLLDYCE